MSDTQWPRFQVFIQEKPDAPHYDAGSVHAPDSEMALLNARDVFARRPTCVSMWVVPANAIYSKTAEELINQQAAKANHSYPNSDSSPVQGEKYHVFCKLKHAGTHFQVGHLDASNPVQALEKAIQKFSSQPQPLVWWVFPARMVTHSNPSEISSLYEPAQSKTFRMPSEFHTLTAMREIEQSEGEK